ncbi:hypothetical protein M2475_001721 [Breznakia sp. PF5-3]|uniref:hypothetical protein n=1 Tax=unclassified Breznakia TaxID=2623764 RepID=UPI00240595B2|nr:MULTISPECIES: hypothetical protein [unclassified Breznakia]MDF9825265.1 hypothetical protein [Breznakia sp. PM6-1]MDF9836145.1 hypothetical protein [Breznakia sp. PF5-3]MDF9838168.1 hypothetical protein [Breznakia sp. PFB2-8]MDF9860154.1 hypothetical protein [Breznakia sp. PH5-24]
MCKECYSEDARITPLLNARECLEQHEQYVCSTCGRCICIAKDQNRGLYRWNFPFKTLSIAKLYLRAAEVASNKCCTIYEVKNHKSNRISYKIFADQWIAEEYINKNTTKTIVPVYKNEAFQTFDKHQIRMLTKTEVTKYLEEKHSR